LRGASPIELVAGTLVVNKLPGLVVNEGIREVAESYTRFARSSTDEGLVARSRHAEFLIDKPGYIRARRLPAERDTWKNSTGCYPG
jgi:hypothetical protein